MKPRFALAALLLALLTGPAAFGQGHGDSLGLSPHWDWRTFDTAHFTMTYPQELDSTARRMAAFLEEAHALMHKTLRWEPGPRTSVVLLDNEDSANGLASANLRFGLVLYATPPDNWLSIGYYDDWLRMLAIHEYTHYLNLDPIRDFHWIFWVLAGDAYRPNTYWTRWLTEGLAVYMETALTSGGRGRSPYYEMILRAAVHENVLDTPDFYTLDRIDGHYPYSPRGEAPYFFGYQLYSQVTRDPVNRERKLTHDRWDAVRKPEDLLGIYSERSSKRIPFFINDNLRNVTGKEWPAYWNEFVAETRARMKQQLETISSEPVTEPSFLDPGPSDALGIEVSPDSRWLAYTQSSSHRRMGLYLRDLSSGETIRVSDKQLGAGHAFTPDSKLLLFSGQRQNGNYRRTSELGAYELEEGRIHWLTDGARFKDPDVSPDGKHVVFAWAKDGNVGIGEAPLIRNEDGVRLGPPRELHATNGFDRAAQPVYGRDGKSVVFSLQRNGALGEQLVRIDRESGALRSLTQGASQNRHAAFGPGGSLYFVSDRTGVENLFRIDAGADSDAAATQVTNVRTGLRFPSFAPDGTLYAAVFNTQGWQLARLQPAERVDSAKVSVAPPPAPRMEIAPARPLDTGKIAPSDYSAWSSLLPRAWTPLLFYDEVSFVVGGIIQGFDTLDLHRYGLGGSWNSSSQRFDWSASYANRSFGPTLSAAASDVTTSLRYSNGELSDMATRLRAEVGLTQPVRFDWSSLEAFVGWSIDRTTTHSDLGASELVVKSDYVPTVTGSLTFSDVESSALAVSAERGHQLFAGGRGYFNSGEITVKGLVSARKFLPFLDHWVAAPSISYSWISRGSPYSEANVVVSNIGTSPLLLDPTSDLDEITIRGYPNLAFTTEEFALPSLDLRIPLWRIYRGFGTAPLFFDNLHLVGFAEAGYVPSADLYLPAAGGGLRLDTVVLVHFPLRLSGEYHQGFERSVGGDGEFRFSLGTSLSL